MHTSRTLIARIAAVATLASAPALASVTILGSPTTYATIQAAVDAAVDGDVILVTTGIDPTGFTITNKSVSVIVPPGPNVSVNTQVRIENLSASRTVLLSGLNLTAENFHSNDEPGLPGLVLASNAGHVRLQGCFIRGGRLIVSGSADNPNPAGHGVEATNCARVVFTQCSLRGREAGAVGGEGMRPGGDGLHSTNSAIALYDCAVEGGRGTDESWPTGGLGGAGAVVNSFGIVASGSSFTGGDGGGGDYIGCSISGDGGVGLVLNEGQAQLLECSTRGGDAGNYYTCAPGSPGVSVVNNDGVLNLYQGTRRMLTGPSQTNDNATVQLTLTGEPGDSFWLIRAQRPAFRFMQALNGLAAVPYPWLVPIAPMGTAGIDGTLSVNLPIGDLSASQIWFMQGLCVDSAGDSFLASPLHLLVVNT